MTIILLVLQYFSTVLRTSTSTDSYNPIDLAAVVLESGGRGLMSNYEWRRTWVCVWLRLRWAVRQPFQIKNEGTNSIKDMARQGSDWIQPHDTVTQSTPLWQIWNNASTPALFNSSFDAGANFIVFSQQQFQISMS